MSDKVTTGGVSPRADKIFKIIITVLALVMCFIQIGKYISIGGKPIVNMYYLRIYALHYMFGMLFAFLMYDWKGKASGWTGLKKKWPDLILSAAAIAVAVYVMIDPSSFQTRLSITANQNDIIFGALATVVTIAAAYKLSGKALPIMAVIFIGYAFLGKYIPGGFGHRGYSLQRVIVNIFGDQGIWGSALATSCNIIFLFILFGAFLEVSGANEIFRDLSISLAGAKRGGPAKIAVISSAIMGTISGSAIANVVTTGAFTIPLMKKQKYRDEFAGAVEAVSSTGGQLMPPVMGAAAFLMAEATAIPYGTICLAALVPALMYYICIFSTVDVESLKANLTGMDIKDIPKLLPVLDKLTALKPNRMEAELLSGVPIRGEEDIEKAAAALLDRGVEQVYISLSGDGLYAAERQGHSVRLPCPKVQVANATGGGDAMAAALAACIAHGRPLAECARMAAGAGALACTAAETIHPGMSWESIEYIVNTAK